MYNRAEQDLILASQQNFIDNAKRYQIYHKMAQCQLKLKKRHASIASLKNARKCLSGAAIEGHTKLKFDGILKDSIKKIELRIRQQESESVDEDTHHELGLDVQTKLQMNECIPQTGNT